MSSRQADVFDFSIRNTVDDILNGYNGTVFAYGQTGAGKSYTMMGTEIDDDENKGIIPRIIEQIFANILSSPGNIEYTVRVSYMEIYMERIRDLLQPQNDNLPVHEEKSRGVYVKGLLEIYVSSVQEVYEVMRRGGLARAVAATNMNQESSRSHSIFVVTITQKNVETGSAKSGQLFLVDLAGSEKVGKTGAIFCLNCEAWVGCFGTLELIFCNVDTLLFRVVVRFGRSPRAGCLARAVGGVLVKIAD